jgi:hypothetical protein
MPYWRDRYASFSLFRLIYAEYAKVNHLYHPERASIDEAYIDLTLPVRNLLLSRYPYLQTVPPDSPLGLLISTGKTAPGTSTLLLLLTLLPHLSLPTLLLLQPSLHQRASQRERRGKGRYEKEIGRM